MVVCDSNTVSIFILQKNNGNGCVEYRIAFVIVQVIYVCWNFIEYHPFAVRIWNSVRCLLWCSFCFAKPKKTTSLYLQISRPHNTAINIDRCAVLHICNIIQYVECTIKYFVLWGRSCCGIMIRLSVYKDCELIIYHVGTPCI